MEERPATPRRGNSPRGDAPANGREPIRGGIDPAALPLPFMSRRRLGQIAGVLVAGWLVIAFGRQVAQASAATDRATDLRAQNAALQVEVGSLQNDLAKVQDGQYVVLAGRAYGLGGPGEIPFTLAAGAPTPGPDAPGSAAARLGAVHDGGSALDGWLDALFGSRS